MAAVVFTVVPRFHGLQHAVALAARCPDRFILLQADFVVPLALTIVVAAKMRHIRDPHDAIDRQVFIVDENENRR